MSENVNDMVSIKLQDQVKDGDEVEMGHVRALRLYIGDEDSLDPKKTLASQQQIDRQEIDAFWAGRNHAMRRSARVVA
jgi:hypothetical protein